MPWALTCMTCRCKLEMPHASCKVGQFPMETTFRSRLDNGPSTGNRLNKAAPSRQRSKERSERRPSEGSKPSAHPQRSSSSSRRSKSDSRDQKEKPTRSKSKESERSLESNSSAQRKHSSSRGRAGRTASTSATPSTEGGKGVVRKRSGESVRDASVSPSKARAPNRKASRDSVSSHHSSESSRQRNRNDRAPTSPSKGVRSRDSVSSHHSSESSRQRNRNDRAPTSPSKGVRNLVRKTSRDSVSRQQSGESSKQQNRNDREVRRHSSHSKGNDAKGANRTMSGQGVERSSSSSPSNNRNLKSGRSIGSTDGSRFGRSSSHSKGSSIISSRHSSSETLRSLKETIGCDEMPSSAHKSSFTTHFDVDAPRKRLERRPSIGTVESNRGHMTGEQRAWAGISDILDKDDGDQSILTQDVLPGEILQAMNRSVASLQSTSNRLRSRSGVSRSTIEDKLKLQPKVLRRENNRDEAESNESESDSDLEPESSHVKNVRRLYGGGSRMPKLMDASFSSLQSEATAKSLLSFISAKNLIVQEEVTDGALRDFLGDMTQVLEQKSRFSKLDDDQKSTTKDPIFRMFTWSSKENVDQQKKDLEEKKRRAKKEARKKLNLTVSINEGTPPARDTNQADQTRFPSEGALNNIGYDPGPSNTMANGYGYCVPNGAISNANTNKSDSTYEMQHGEAVADPYCSFNGDYGEPLQSETLPRTPLTVGSSFNTSMPSLLSVRESEISSEDFHANKSNSFGDLNFDALHTDPMQHPDGSGNNRAAPKKMIRKVVRRKVKKKKKKKKKANQSTNTDATEKHDPEDFDDFFPEDTEARKPKKQRSRGLVEALSRTFSKQDGLVSPRAEKMNRYKETMSPMKMIRSKLPNLTLFGKTRRGSPSSILDTGRHEAHFFDDFIEQDDEGCGGLLE